MGTLHKVLTSVLARCSSIHGMLSAVLRAQEEEEEEEEAESGAPGGGAKYAALRQASADVLEHICDTAHQRVGRLLAVRERLNTHLCLHDFTRLFDETVEFVSASEKLCGRQKKHALRATLLVQAKVFVEQLHAGNVSKLNLLLDQERWMQVDVPAEIQYLVNECIKPSDAFRGPFAKAAVMRVAEPPSKQLMLDGDRYSIVAVLTALLKMVSDYIACSVELPALGADIVQRLLDLLKIFNTRSCQLVLGARAMHLAGLKTITAKHLALSAQCVVFLHSFTPFVQTALKRHLPERQHVLLGEFERLSADLAAHRDELYAKLVAIMKERLDYHCRAIADEAWNAPGGGEAGTYMKGVVKELQALHRVLWSTLDARAVQGVVCKIANMLSKRLPEHFAKLPLSTSASQHRVAADVEFLREALEALEGVNVPESDMQALHTYCNSLPAFRSDRS